MNKRKVTYIILTLSILVNLLAMVYILKNDVYIIVKDHLLWEYEDKDIDYSQIDREVGYVGDEAMAERLAKAYLGDRLNYKEESDPLVLCEVLFLEERYEYIVEITVNLQAGKYEGMQEQYILGIRKDYGIITYYDSWEEIGDFR